MGLAPRCGYSDEPPASRLPASAAIPALGAIRPAGQILKMKKFSIFGLRPRDNVALSEAIKALRMRRGGCVTQ
jgi:hypothetical protein